LNELNVAIVAGLMIFSAVLTLAYAALNNTRPGYLKEQSEDGSATARRALSLLEVKSRLVITYQLCLALTQTLVTAVIVVHLHETAAANSRLEAALLAGLIVALSVLTITQIAPEGIGSAHAPRLYPLLTPFLGFVVWALTPITAGLILISKGLAALFGSSQMVNTVTEEEVLTLVQSGNFEEDEKDMIYSVLQLDQRDARQLMVPRMDIVAVSIDDTLEQAAEIFTNSGYSRLPVYEGTIDNIQGILYAKDLLPLWRRGNFQTARIRDLMRTANFVPETLRADDLLQLMQKRNFHMAIVVDEYGGTSGLITIENLIEEIVGDIRDEYDQNEEIEYTKISDTEHIVAGSMNISDINELLDLDIEEDANYDTIGGLIYATLGRVPHLGDRITRDNYELEVSAVEGRRIRKVKITLMQPTETQSDSKERPTAIIEDRPEANEENA
jgi:putative hemolysin